MASYKFKEGDLIRRRSRRQPNEHIIYFVYGLSSMMAQLPKSGLSPMTLNTYKIMDTKTLKTKTILSAVEDAYEKI